MAKRKFKSLVDLEMSRNVQNIVNLIANIIAFAVSLVISFFISPYIVKNLGAEANGFVTLANNFVSYATLARTALNAIGSRYIIVNYHKDKFEEANKYYSSLFFGDLILSIVFFVLSVACVWKLEVIINVSDNLVNDVKILFSLIFANFILNTICTVFNSAPYIKNKVYLQSIRDIQANLIRAILLAVLFSVFVPKVFFLGIATLIPGMITIIYNIYYKKRLVPDLKVNKNDFSWKKIKELLSQGIWNSISSLGEMLLTSLDLLVANLFISSTDMGILSVAKSVPNMISGLAQTMASVFFSAMTIDYAHDDFSALKETVKISTRLIGAIVTIPLSFLIVFGQPFYSLWQPTLDAKQLQVLSILTCMGVILCAGCNSIVTIFTITLHVKQSSISVLISGVVSLTITLCLVKFTDLGIYAIAAVSSIVDTIRMVCYIVPTASKYIGAKKSTFIPVVFKSLISTGSLCLIGFIIKRFININSWLSLVLTALLFCLLSVIANFFIMLNKSSRELVKDFVISKIKHKE